MKILKKIFIYLIAFLKSIFNLFKPTNKAIDKVNNKQVPSTTSITKDAQLKQAISTSNIDTTNANNYIAYLDHLIDDYLIEKKHYDLAALSITNKTELSTLKEQVIPTLSPHLTNPELPKLVQETVDNYLDIHPLVTPHKQKVIAVVPVSNLDAPHVKENIQLPPKEKTLDDAPVDATLSFDNDASPKLTELNDDIVIETHPDEPIPPIEDVAKPLEVPVIESVTVDQHLEKEAVPPKVETKIETKVEDKVEDKPKEPKDLKEKVKEPPIVIPDLEPKIKQLTNQIDNPKEQDLSPLTNQINKLLNDLEDFLLLHEKSLSQEELAKLNKQKEKLRSLKQRIQNQEKVKTQMAEDELATTIEQDTIKQLRDTYQAQTLEDELEIKKLLNLQNSPDITKIETYLLKQRVQKIINLLVTPSLVLFPFIKNRYFRTFSISFFIAHHLGFMNQVLIKDPAIPYQELDNISKGKDALKSSLDKTYDNILTLDILENKIFTKYPHLQYDEEFTSQLAYLHNLLNNHYEQLIEQTDIIDIRHARLLRQIKTLKRKRQIS